MGKPAARLGDMTIHGGTIVSGCFTVLIGGQPAARVGDPHVCPMVTPAPVPVPHVGMPIIPPGAVTVLIGGFTALLKRIKQEIAQAAVGQATFPSG